MVERVFLVEYGTRHGRPPWWGTVTVWGEDERDARSIALRMAARHRTDILSFTRVDPPGVDLSSPDN